MDPQATFYLFLSATAAGDLDGAAAACADYRAWRRRGGFCAEDSAGDYVVTLDCERDRYGVHASCRTVPGPGTAELVEAWRDACTEHARGTA